MQANGAPANGGWRHAWPWFLARGLVFFALGFALAGIGSWTDAVWLAWMGFGFAMIGMWMLTIAWRESRRGRGAAWWQGYRTAYERNSRATDHGPPTESSAPQRPNDR